MGSALAGISFAVLAFASGYMWSMSEQGSLDRGIWGAGYLVFSVFATVCALVGVFKV